MGLFDAPPLPPGMAPPPVAAPTLPSEPQAPEAPSGLATLLGDWAPVAGDGLAHPPVYDRVLLDAGPSEKGWSRIETITRCQQLAAYRHKIGLSVGINAMPLLRGSMGHIGLAHHYARLRARQQGQDPERFYTVEEAVRLLAAQPAGAEGARNHGKNVAMWEAQVPLVLAALQAYLREYGTNEKMEIMLVEEVLTANVGGHAYTQRADLVARGRDGLVKVFDHKFVGSLRGKSAADLYTLSGQFLGFSLFGRSLWGERFSGVFGNFIGWNNGENFTFLRKPPELAPFAESCHPLAVKDAEEEWARLEAEGRDPWLYPKKLNPQLCRGLFGKCPGWELCRWGPSRKDLAFAPTTLED